MRKQVQLTASHPVIHVRQSNQQCLVSGKICRNLAGFTGAYDQTKKKGVEKESNLKPQ